MWQDGWRCGLVMSMSLSGYVLLAEVVGWGSGFSGGDVNLLTFYIEI